MKRARLRFVEHEIEEQPRRLYLLGKSSWKQMAGKSY
jgi:hypothetical protein